MWCLDWIFGTFGGVVGATGLVLSFGLAPWGVIGGSSAANLMASYGGVIRAGSLISRLQWLGSSTAGIASYMGLGALTGGAIVVRRGL